MVGPRHGGLEPETAPELSEALRPASKQEQEEGEEGEEVEEESQQSLTICQRHPLDA
ncbi:unnamed protein product [Ectocarpus sp. CCAP 1310/34]|nr:unnamed protein product [Ectocarpus sp. CCAP 1310/34]